MECQQSRHNQIIHPRLGRVLETLRFNSGFTVDEAAELLGMPPALVLSYEQGLSTPGSYSALLRQYVDSYRIREGEQELSFMEQFILAAGDDMAATRAEQPDITLGGYWHI